MHDVRVDKEAIHSQWEEIAEAESERDPGGQAPSSLIGGVESAIGQGLRFGHFHPFFLRCLLGYFSRSGGNGTLGEE